MPANPYKRSVYDTGTPDRVKEWIDERVSGAGKAIYRGGMQVLAAGFGKGLLATAALATVAIVAIAIFAPVALNFSAGLTVAQSVEQGLLFAGNSLLGHPLGLMTLFAGGAVGSMAAAHGENTRIGKEAAEIQAVQFSQAREANARTPQLAQEQEQCTMAEGGHCAKLMREQHEHREHTR